MIHNSWLINQTYFSSMNAHPIRSKMYRIYFLEIKNTILKQEVLFYKLEVSKSIYSIIAKIHIFPTTH